MAATMNNQPSSPSLTFILKNPNSQYDSYLPRNIYIPLQWQLMSFKDDHNSSNDRVITYVLSGPGRFLEQVEEAICNHLELEDTELFENDNTYNDENRYNWFSSNYINPNDNLEFEPDAGEDSEDDDEYSDVEDNDDEF